MAVLPPTAAKVTAGRHHPRPPRTATTPAATGIRRGYRLPNDEIWHFYGGDPIRLVLLHSDGRSSDVWLGTDSTAGHVVQHVIPAGTWQAGELHPAGTYGLFGCTMAPGFTGAGFVAASRAELLDGWPDRSVDIERLTVADGEATTMPAGFAT